VFIPIGRTINPVTGTDFEGIGVTPDILIPQEHAFTAAHKIALDAILKNLDGSLSGADKALAKEAQSALKELTPDQSIGSK
jgi:C-terminal processing protease CtpA/Prc